MMFRLFNNLGITTIHNSLSSDVKAAIRFI